MTARRAAFLDRDGTINVEQSFIRTPDALRLLPGVVPALARLRAAGFVIAVVTNQSGIARGLYSEHDLARVHERLHALVDGGIDGYFHCPHHPTADAGTPYGPRACTCRKPAPGLMLRAAEVLDLDLAGGFVVGDSARDLLAARDLPLTRILVRSGKPWQAQLAELEAAELPPHHVVDDLAAAVDLVV